jgi:hypothetical protein
MQRLARAGWRHVMCAIAPGDTHCEAVCRTGSDRIRPFAAATVTDLNPQSVSESSTHVRPPVRPPALWSCGQHCGRVVSTVVGGVSECRNVNDCELNGIGYFN